MSDVSLSLLLCPELLNCNGIRSSISPVVIVICLFVCLTLYFSHVTFIFYTGKHHIVVRLFLNVWEEINDLFQCTVFL